MANKQKNFEAQFYDSRDIFYNADGWLKNKNFIQEYDKYFTYTNQLMEQDATAYRVFNLLAHLCHNNNTILITTAKIAEILHKSERVIKRSIKSLKEYNFIAILKDGKQNVYFLNPHIVCNGDAYYKNKLISTYIEIMGKIEINLPLESVDEEAIKNFQESEKIKFYFDFQNKHKEFSYPTETEIEEQYKTLKTAGEMEPSELTKTLWKIQQQNEQIQKINKNKEDPKPPMIDENGSTDDFSVPPEGFDTIDLGDV